MKKKLVLILTAIVITNVVIAQIEVLTDPLFNGTEGIIYDEDNNRYFVGNATDGKLLTIDSEYNVDVFKDDIGANMIMGFEIAGDSLFVATNYL